ncbi:hypothetical protein WAI453_002154 [Rhynchosporium graminicola]
MSFVPINPRPMLQNLVNEEVVIRLKWGQTEYKGRLVSIDSYMNIQLSGAEEWIDQEMTSVLGQVLIRCNNAGVDSRKDIGNCRGLARTVDGVGRAQRIHDQKFTGHECNRFRCREATMLWPKA